MVLSPIFGQLNSTSHKLILMEDERFNLIKLVRKTCRSTTNVSKISQTNVLQQGVH